MDLKCEADVVNKDDFTQRLSVHVLSLKDTVHGRTEDQVAHQVCMRAVRRVHCAVVAPPARMSCGHTARPRRPSRPRWGRRARWR